MLVGLMEESITREIVHHQGGRPQTYSAQKAQTLWYVGKCIPPIYAAMDNRKVDHKTSISRWKVRFVIKLFLFLTNYSYIHINLIDKCSLSKEVHAGS